MRGNIFYQMQMLDDAHENYDEAIRMEPNNDRFWHQKGLAYQQSGSKDNVSEAIRMFKQALELNEKCVAARFHLGIMYHQNNNFHEALQCFTQVFEDEKNNPDLFIKRGNVYLDMGNYQFAIDDFDQAINTQESMIGLFLRGTAKLRSKDYVGANEDFEKALTHENTEV